MYKLILNWFVFLKLLENQVVMKSWMQLSRLDHKVTQLSLVQTTVVIEKPYVHKPQSVKRTRTRSSILLLLQACLSVLINRDGWLIQRVILQKKKRTSGSQEKNKIQMLLRLLRVGMTAWLFFLCIFLNVCTDNQHLREMNSLLSLRKSVSWSDHICCVQPEGLS